MGITSTHTALTNRRQIAAPPDITTFGRDVLAGLSKTPKELPSKYLYDRRGSELFDLLCEVPDYYPARTELAIVREHADSIVDHIGRRITLVELGNGNGLKTRMLLQRLAPSSVYVPIDISQDHLTASAAAMQRAFEQIDVYPLCADFTDDFAITLPASAPQNRVVYFPSSTIGNFQSGETRRLLRRIAHICGRGGKLLVGLDLEKDPAVIEAAYNDRAGVMAELNLNLLLRMNRELGGDFDLAGFKHVATYNRAEHRIEMRLVSNWQQSPSACGRTFEFAAGEAITTQYSYKFCVDGFDRLAKSAGFSPEWCWFDEREYFCVMCLGCER